MFKIPAFRVSRDLPSSCQEECKWIYNACLVMELANGKYPTESDEGIIQKKKKKKKKSATWTDVASASGDLSLSQVNQSDSQKCVHAQSDPTSLIPHLDRDVSISCILKCPRTEYGSIACLNRSFRSLVQSGDLYKLRRQLGIVEYWVYFSCELLQWEAFDPVSLRWVHLPRMYNDNESGENRCFTNSDKESLAVGTELLVFGSGIHSQKIYRYNILMSSWSVAKPMNEGRSLFGSASVGEIGIVAGGRDRNGNVLATAELYNADTGTWATLPRLNTPRKMCSGVFLDGKFHVIGGIGVDKKTMLTSGEAYDMEKRTWVEIPDMFPVSNEREAIFKAPPLLAVAKNNLYAAFSDEHELRRYDKVGNTWVTVGRLPDRAESVHGWGLAFRACGDMLVVIGAPNSMVTDFVDVNGWVPDEGPPRWRLLGRKESSCFVYNCAVMGC